MVEVVDVIALLMVACIERDTSLATKKTSLLLSLQDFGAGE